VVVAQQTQRQIVVRDNASKPNLCVDPEKNFLQTKEDANRVKITQKLKRTTNTVQQIRAIRTKLLQYKEHAQSVQVSQHQAPTRENA